VFNQVYLWLNIPMPIHILNCASMSPWWPRLKAFAAAHPEVRMLAGHMWLDFFTSSST
jgi:hypothetical protein